MKNILWLSLVAVVACGSSNNSTPTTTNPPPTTTPPASNPPKPAIGATQADRMGRAAVNTALNNTFNPSSQAAGQAKDAYNASANPSTWTASFSAEIQKNLAIFDALDGTCGNQVLAGPTPTANRYSTLAGVLADDRLYVRTDKTTCAAYLAVETDAVGLTTSTADCGGRTPIEDTIDTTYSLLVIGQLSGVNDGVQGDGLASTTAFPFLLPPH